MKHECADQIFSILNYSEQVQADDKDFGDFGTLTYDIFSDEMKEFFSIDNQKGEIVTKVRLDREDRKTYEIPIIATDGGGRSGFATVKVKVGDLNDNAPVFSLREYKVAIHNNMTMNSTFLKVRSVYNLIFVLSNLLWLYISQHNTQFEL